MVSTIADLSRDTDSHDPLRFVDGHQKVVSNFVLRQGHFRTHTAHRLVDMGVRVDIYLDIARLSLDHE